MTPNEMREARARATPGKWYPNGQEFDTRVMLKGGSFIGEFDHYDDAVLACCAANNFPAIADEMERLQRENERLTTNIKGIRDYVQKCMKQDRRLSYTDVLTLLSAGRVFLSRPDNPAFKEQADGE